MPRPSSEVTHEHHDRSRLDDERGDRPALARAHLLLVVGPGGDRPDRDRPRRGRLPVHARGPADPRLQQPADVGQHRPRRPARGRRHHRAGDASSSTSSRPSPPRSGRASGRSWPRSCPATSTRSSSRSAAPRRSRTRSSWPATTPGRHKILARYRSYHGATFGAMTLTGDPRRWAERAGAGRRRPLPRHAPLGRGGAASRRPRACRASRTSSATRAPHTIAAIFLETIVGTNGILIPPDGYIQGVRELCDRHGILMVADEVMAGFGRTGKWFAVDHWGVDARPDDDGQGPDQLVPAARRGGDAPRDRREVRRRCSTRRPDLQQPPGQPAPPSLATIARLRGGRPDRERRPPRPGHARAPPAAGGEAPERRGDPQPRPVRDPRPRPQPRPMDADDAVQRHVATR